MTRLVLCRRRSSRSLGNSSRNVVIVGPSFFTVGGLYITTTTTVPDLYDKLTIICSNEEYKVVVSFLALKLSLNNKPSPPPLPPVGRGVCSKVYPGGINSAIIEVGVEGFSHVSVIPTISSLLSVT